MEILEINFFRNASKLINDKEFDKLLKKYEYLISLISSIINFRKNNEEDLKIIFNKYYFYPPKYVFIKSLLSLSKCGLCITSKILVPRCRSNR